MNYSDQAALEAFVVNNEDLERLEALLAQFNIFEAIGVVRQELRHSDFLAFLLNPAQNHGLGDLFLKRLLKNVLVNADSPPVSPVEIDVADLREAAIYREWRNIDILVVDEENRLAAVIENKVASTEHSSQLQRYREIVAREFAGYRPIFVYLTPEGDEASDEAYIPFSYTDIAKLVDATGRAYQATLGPDIFTLMAHYTTMLRRYIVTDSEIAELCKKIYQRHQRALDLIFEYLPDLQSQLSELLVSLAGDSKAYKFEIGYQSKRYIEFYPVEWNELPPQLKAGDWDMKGMPLDFIFINAADQLKLRLYLYLDYPEPVVQAIHQLALAQPKVFQYASTKLSTSRVQIYRKQFLTPKDYEDADLETLRPKVEAEWQKFVVHDLPAILEKLAGVDWPKK